MEDVRFFITVVVVTGACLLHTQASCKRLGQHTPPSKGAIVLAGNFPMATVFFHHFVNTGKPLLMKNVLDETEFPAYQKWTDHYLREQFGDEVVSVEMGKKEDRDADKSFTQLSQFLDYYTVNDMYMVHTLPTAMHDDVRIPSSLRCGGFQEHLQEMVMWFSSGNTSSVLHYDTLDNINCVLDGKKKLLLIDKAYKADIEDVGWVEDGAYSELDVESVDPHLYPGIAKTPWVEINLSKGDCAFIPNRWYHHIYSPPGRNLAVNFWVSSLLWFNQSDCKDIERSNAPVHAFNLASPNIQLRSEFLSEFKSMKEVSESVFTAKSWCTDPAQSNKLWRRFNKNGDKKVTWEEFYSVNIDELVQEFPECFHAKVDHDVDAEYSTGENEEEDLDLKRKNEEFILNSLKGAVFEMSESEDDEKWAKATGSLGDNFKVTLEDAKVNDEDEESDGGESEKVNFESEKVIDDVARDEKVTDTVEGDKVKVTGEVEGEEDKEDYQYSIECGNDNPTEYEQLEVNSEDADFEEETMEDDWNGDELAIAIDDAYEQRDALRHGQGTEDDVEEMDSANFDEDIDISDNGEVDAQDNFDDGSDNRSNDNQKQKKTAKHDEF